MSNSMMNAERVDLVNSPSWLALDIHNLLAQKRMAPVILQSALGGTMTAPPAGLGWLVNVQPDGSTSISTSTN